MEWCFRLSFLLSRTPKLNRTPKSMQRSNLTLHNGSQTVSNCSRQRFPAAAFLCLCLNPWTRTQASLSFDCVLQPGRAALYTKRSPDKCSIEQLRLLSLSLSRVASLGCNESRIKVPSSTVATRQAGGQSAYFQLLLLYVWVRVCVCASATYVGNDVIAASC